MGNDDYSDVSTNTIKLVRQASERALEVYRNNLDTPIVRKYFDDRGVELETAKKFEWGYAPEGGVLLRSIPADVHAGLMSLVGLGDGGDNFVEFFRESLIAPVRDFRKNIVGFTGVSINGKPEVKHTRGVSPFLRDDIPYNIYAASHNVGEEGRLFVVNSPLEILMASQSGIKSVVSSYRSLEEKDILDISKAVNESELVFCFNTSDSTKALETSEYLLGIKNARLLLYSGRDIDWPNVGKSIIHPAEYYIVESLKMTRPETTASYLSELRNLVDVLGKNSSREKDSESLGFSIENSPHRNLENNFVKMVLHDGKIETIRYFCDSRGAIDLMSEPEPKYLLKFLREQTDTNTLFLSRTKLFRGQTLDTIVEEISSGAFSKDHVLLRKDYLFYLLRSPLDELDEEEYVRRHRRFFSEREEKKVAKAVKRRTQPLLEDMEKALTMIKFKSLMSQLDGIPFGLDSSQFESVVGDLDELIRKYQGET